MLFHARADRQNIRVKNDVFRRKPGLLCEQLVGTFADCDFIVAIDRLPLFVESHDNNGRTVFADCSRLIQELFFAFLQADRIDDALSLQAFQTGFDDTPFRTVNHDRYRHVWLIVVAQQVQKFLHARFTVKQPFIHVDVDDVRPTLNLTASDAERFIVILFTDQTSKLPRPGHVGPFTDHDESRFGSEFQLIQTAVG